MKQPYIFLVLFLLLLVPVGIQGQEYRYEVGFSGGLSSYMGEANTDKPLENPNGAFGLTSRLNLSGNTALRGNVFVAGLSGSTIGNDTHFMNGSGIEFKRSLVDANIQFELGFLQYGVPDYQPGFQKWSPYVALGLGLTGYSADKNRISLNIPFGIGVKYKVLPMMNVGAEWMFRKTMTDKLDYSTVSSNFQLDNAWTGNSNWNKNMDWYSILVIYVTFDLWGTSPNCYK